MKTFLHKISAITGVIALLTVMLVSQSCKKDKTCHGKVKVVDSNGAVISGATVHLAAPSVNGDVVYDNTTDGSGEASFDVKLPAIFDVTATHPGYSATGVGVLRLDEPGKDADVTVKIPN
ncbi:MAG TPA: carboxypeptidase-like regulatory domain-containing protein [Bacteroidia bacterium]|nr:carboxypeptidase-like regulatory domain-containing protein [Bacteroidia bacterium]